MSEQYDINLVRHGQSTANANAAVFEGGAPDNTPLGPVDLTSLGVRQGCAAGIASVHAEVVIGRMYSSKMRRAGHTAAEVALATARSVDGVLSIDGIHEISHGSLELEGVSTETSSRLRSLSRLAMQGMLIEHGLEQNLAAKYSPWIAFQGRGDGESYVEAGVRAWNALQDHRVGPDALIVGHHGTWRSTVGLAASLTPTGLLDLSEALEIMADEQQEAKATVVSGRIEAGRELSDRELMAIFDPIAERMVSFARLLNRLKLPHFSHIEAWPKLGNGSLLQVRIHPNSPWERVRMIDPVLPDNNAEPTYDNTRARVTVFAE